MAYQSIWYFTNLPEDIVNIIDKDLHDNFDENMNSSKIHGDNFDKKKRNSKNTWIPTTHWIGGFVWHYVQRANRDNFLFDLSHIDGENMQYTRYDVGEFYGWHADTELSIYHKPKIMSGTECQSIDNKDAHNDYLNKNTEHVRKLSFSIQLSSPDDYEGGNVELIDEVNQHYIAPRQRGTIILFDSRTKHRVNEVTKGVRKSIVGWVLGPRWK